MFSSRRSAEGILGSSAIGSLMVPKKLYKYRPFNASTLRLLSQAETYYADPLKFNDPLNCKPVISVDTPLWRFAS